MNRSPIFVAVAAAFALWGCSTTPPSDPVVEGARASVNAVEADAQVARYAPLELRRTEEAWRSAESAWRNGDDTEKVHHLAYLADREAALARETARLRAAQAATSRADVERERVRLEARTREAEHAREEAQAARTAALVQHQQAEQARTQALLAAQQARLEHERAAAARQQAMAAQQNAAAASAQVADLQQRTDELATEVQGLKTQATNAGTVVTLGDVLFDVDRATLNPGGERAVRQLAGVLQRDPSMKIRIGGFTDSTGTREYNAMLSEARADAVRDVLAASGVAPDRIEAHGYGEAYPVATNSTTAGRQLNRRVEVFVEDRNGTAQAAAMPSSATAQTSPQGAVAQPYPAAE